MKKRQWLKTMLTIKTGTIRGKVLYVNGSPEDENWYDVIQKGWRTIGGRRYYLGHDGVVRKGWQTIDGVRYHFDENGILIRNEL